MAVSAPRIMRMHSLRRLQRRLDRTLELAASARRVCGPPPASSKASRSSCSASSPGSSRCPGRRAARSCRGAMAARSSGGSCRSCARLRAEPVLAPVPAGVSLLGYPTAGRVDALDSGAVERGSARIDRRFDAVMFDWDGTAVPDRRADATELRVLVETALRARAASSRSPAAPTSRTSTISSAPGRPARVGCWWTRIAARSSGRSRTAGPVLLQRRETRPGEDEALDRAAAAIVAELAGAGLATGEVSQRLNRRKIDLMPVPEWDDPPKSRIAELLAATPRAHPRCGVLVARTRSASSPARPVAARGSTIPASPRTRSTSRSA